ncbi:putative alcohol dehydrogenase [Xylogone sp. PMI_703]|nr:putative alcohol dehydrogenase [Xylogone sp. PMI_703]
MASQKAVFVQKKGNPVVLGRREVPVPREGEVLIKVTATMLLPHDTYGRDWGLFIGEKLPYILGSNLAGVVQEVGPNVTSLVVGDRVFGEENLSSPVPDQAGLQEYAILETSSLSKTPDGFTDDEVATIPINLVTSFMALFTNFGFNFPAPWTKEAVNFDYGSEKIVIIAAGSNAGKFAVQLAKMVNIGTIIAIAGLANENELRSFGATHVIDRHSESIVSQVHSITGADGVTHIYDCYNWTFELASSLLSSTQPSQLRTLHSLNEAKIADIKTQSPLCEPKYIVCSSENLHPHTEQFWLRLPTWIVDKKIHPTKFRAINGLNVDDINAALDSYRDGHPQAQVIVRPGL